MDVSSERLRVCSHKLIELLRKLRLAFSNELNAIYRWSEALPLSTLT